MNHPTADAMEAQLAALVEDDSDKLGLIAEKFVRLKNLEAEAKAAKAKVYTTLMTEMEAQGMTGLVTGDGARVSTVVTKGWRIKEGSEEEEHMNNMEATREWVEKYNPQVTGITQTIIKNTVESYIEQEGADAEMPPFIEESEYTKLSVRKVARK